MKPSIPIRFIAYIAIIIASILGILLAHWKSKFLAEQEQLSLCRHQLLEVTKEKDGIFLDNQYLRYRLEQCSKQFENLDQVTLEKIIKYNESLEKNKIKDPPNK